MRPLLYTNCLLSIATALLATSAALAAPATTSPSSSVPNPNQEPWRQFLPGKPLVLATTSGDLEAVEGKVAAVLGDLSLQYTSVLSGAKQMAGLSELQLSDRRLVVGVALADETLAGEAPPYPFALLPVESFERAVASIGGEVTGDVGVATLLNYDLCLAPCADWVLVTPIEQLEAARAVSQKRGGEESLAKRATPDVGLEISSAGLAYLADRAGAVPPRSRRQALRQGIIWPPTLASVDAALLQNEHLIARWRKLFDDLNARVAVGAQGAHEGQLTTRLTASILPEATPPHKQDLRERQATLFPAAITQGAIWRMQGAGDTAVASLLGRLLNGYQQGRSDEMEVDKYPEEAFAEFESAAAPLLNQIAWLDAIARQHRGKAPLYSNQAALLTLHDTDAFTAALQDMVTRWNALMKASQSQTALVFTEQTFDRDGLTGLEFDVDMVEVVADEWSKEMEALMERFFGPKGHYTIRLISLRDGQALLTDLPWESARELAKQASEATPSPISSDALAAWQARVCPTRYLAWQRRIQKVMQNRTGDIPAETAPPEWMTVTASAAKGVFELRATAPRATLQAVGKALQAK